jgi:hypothetical protein
MENNMPDDWRVVLAVMVFGALTVHNLGKIAQELREIKALLTR